MISTEFILLLLIFLVYISFWYYYLDNIIETSKIVIEKFERENYINEMSKKMNTLCYTNGKINLEFKNEIEIEIYNNKLRIGEFEKEIYCDVENVKLNKNKFTIEKRHKITVS